MPFNPNTLPPVVQAAYKQGPKFWPLTVQKALAAAIFDITKLTDMVFYLHYPERMGKPLKPHESKLINKWKAFRTTISPWVQQQEKVFNARPKPCWPCGIEGTDVRVSERYGTKKDLVRNCLGGLSSQSVKIFAKRS